MAETKRSARGEDSTEYDRSRDRWTGTITVGWKPDGRRDRITGHLRPRTVTTAAPADDPKLPAPSPNLIMKPGTAVQVLITQTCRSPRMSKGDSPAVTLDARRGTDPRSRGEGDRGRRRRDRFPSPTS